ncbi:hypothetical protein Ancab_018812 [Ancistrocladus abbreviatus]
MTLLFLLIPCLPLPENMVGFTATTNPTNLIGNPTIPRATHAHQIRRSYGLSIKIHFHNPKLSRNFAVYAADKGNGKNGEPKETEKTKKNDGNGDDLKRDNQWSQFNNLRWGELLLDPDPDNILAVGLTGLLTWASVQVLWQLLIVSLAILVAALKSSCSLGLLNGRLAI